MSTVVWMVLIVATLMWIGRETEHMRRPARRRQAAHIQSRQHAWRSFYKLGDRPARAGDGFAPADALPVPSCRMASFDCYGAVVRNICSLHRVGPRPCYLVGADCWGPVESGHCAFHRQPVHAE
jgi:hypothetical protein